MYKYQFARLCLVSSALSLPGCSGSDLTDLTDVTEAPEAQAPSDSAHQAVDPEQLEADFQALVQDSLSSSEQARIQRLLDDQKVSRDRVDYVGRMVLVDDVYMYAEDLLQAS